MHEHWREPGRGGSTWGGQRAGPGRAEGRALPGPAERLLAVSERPSKTAQGLGIPVPLSQTGQSPPAQCSRLPRRGSRAKTLTRPRLGYSVGRRWGRGRACAVRRGCGRLPARSLRCRPPAGAEEKRGRRSSTPRNEEFPFSPESSAFLEVFSAFYCRLLNICIVKILLWRM